MSDMPVRSGTPAKPFGESWLDDEEIVGKLLVLLQAGNPVATACSMLGIPRSNFYGAMKAGRNNPEHPLYGTFVVRVEQAMAACNARWLNVINRAADRGDWKAAMALLERRDPENFGPKKDAVTGGQQNVVIELRFPGQGAPVIDADSEEVEDGDYRELGAGE